VAGSVTIGSRPARKSSFDRGCRRVLVEQPVGGEGRHALNTHAYDVGQAVGGDGGRDPLRYACFFNRDDANLDVRVRVHVTLRDFLVDVDARLFVIGGPELDDRFLHVDRDLDSLDDCLARYLDFLGDVDRLWLRSLACDQTPCGHEGEQCNHHPVTFLTEHCLNLLL
jgi:hypothetical protein